MTNSENSYEAPTEEGRNPDGSPLYDDVNVSFIVMIGVISAIVTFVSIMAVQGLFFHMQDGEIRQKVYGTPVAAAQEIKKQKDSLEGFYVAKEGSVKKAISIEQAMGVTLAELKSDDDKVHGDKDQPDSSKKHVTKNHKEKEDRKSSE